MTIRKAVVPAAGLGTRLLPASKSLPKEMIPVVDRPAIQYVVEEAARAGIRDVLIITSRGKAVMEDHFDRSVELEKRLEDTGKLFELDLVRSVAELADVHYVRQKEALGLGHAVATARAHIGDEPFAVMLPDEVVPAPLEDEPPLLERMIDAYERHGGTVVAVKEVEREQVSAYGVVAPAEEVSRDVLAISRFVEKPRPEEAPSTLAATGRYVLSPRIFQTLDRTKPGAGNEIQLTDAINLLLEEADVYAYVHRGPIFDVGRKLDYLKASMEIALRRNDLRTPLGDWLVELAAALRPL